MVLPIVNAISDTTPPKVVGFDFEPKVIDLTNSSQTITVTATLIDDLSGVSDGEMGGMGVSPSQARFFCPSGKQFADVLFQSPSDNPTWNNPNIVSGNKLNGTYVSKMTLPQYGESGVWSLKNFLVVDEVGNMKNYEKGEIAALGSPTEIKVL
jgi:hypothetical protein